MEPAPRDTLGTASVACAIGGVVVYCCGSFLCVGWLSFPIWLVGAILGIVGAATLPPGQKTMSVLGLVFNVLPAIGFGVLMALGIGAGIVSSILDQAQHH